MECIGIENKVRSPKEERIVKALNEFLTPSPNMPLSEYIDRLKTLHVNESRIPSCLRLAFGEDDPRYQQFIKEK